jgi:hypothetical protein
MQILFQYYASSANILVQNCTINSDHIASDEEPRTLGEPPGYVRVVRQGKKDAAEVGCFSLSCAVN